MEKPMTARWALISLVMAVVLTIGAFVVLSFSHSKEVKQFVHSTLFLPGGPNLVRNGIFEGGNVAGTQDEPLSGGKANCKELCGGSSALDNWQVFRQPEAGTQSCASAKDAVCWGPVPNGLGISTPNNPDNKPARLIDLTGFFGRPPEQYGELRQTIENTQPGTEYELSFAMGTSSLFPPKKPAGKVAFYGVNVDAVGSDLGHRVFTSEPNVPDVSHWETQTMRFKATDTAVTLEFAGSGSPGSGEIPPTTDGGDYVGIYNVVLQKVCFFIEALVLGCP